MKPGRANYEAFLAGDIDASYLILMMRKCGNIYKNCGHDYPNRHRIKDVDLDGRPMTISRCLLCDEDVFLADAAEVNPIEGVPYELSGAALRDWVRAEIESPAKGPQHWNHWLGGKRRNREVKERG